MDLLFWSFVLLPPLICTIVSFGVCKGLKFEWWLACVVWPTFGFLGGALIGMVMLMIFGLINYGNPFYEAKSGGYTGLAYLMVMLFTSAISGCVGVIVSLGIFVTQVVRKVLNWANAIENNNRPRMSSRDILNKRQRSDPKSEIRVQRGCHPQPDERIK